MKTRYRYAVSFLQKIVVSEQLFFYPAGREAKLFGRNFQQFEFGDYLKGPKAAVAELTAPNQLFLSKAAKNNEESAGTQKLFVLGGLMLRALMNGRTIFIDEFERSLHPLIATHILQIFQNPAINDRGAQLVIATHDTNLLGTPVLRRDQIWMVEKNARGESALFSLADVQGIRPDIPYEKWYLSGRFGGVPGIEKLNLELNFAHEAA